MARVYKETVNVYGLGKFDKICNVTRKGLFKIWYPKKIVSEDIIKRDYVCGTNLKEVEEEWKEKIQEFEILHRESTMVIRYYMAEASNWGDGHGEGFYIYWGVFKKINFSGRPKYYYVRGMKMNSYYEPKRDEMKEMLWKENREKFFMNMESKLLEMRDRLFEFLEKTVVGDLIDPSSENVPAIGILLDDDSTI